MIKLGLLIAVLMALSGCQVAVPLVSAYKDMGVHKQDRINLLRDTLKGFRAAVETNRVQTALGFVHPKHPEVADQLRADLRNARKKERVVDRETDNVVFDQDARRAEVEVLVRYFRIPYYIVQDRIEHQEWQFELTGGWRLAARRIEEIKD